jgi:predicted GH43/DUF377 family glycosyl hydrolase
MWFSYQAFGFGVQWCIGYAVSTDGINWLVHSRNPVLRPGGPGTFDSEALFTPFVIKVGNQLRMYYCGYNGSTWQTGVATSQDAINWTKYSGNPVLTVRPGTWEDIGANGAAVLYDGTQFLMFYTGHVSLTQAEVGLAISMDGYAWTRSPLNPILKRGPVGSWDAQSVRSVAAFTGNGKYYLLYDAGSATSIGFASSPDGISWTKYDGNPVFFPGSPGAWDDSRVEFGAVVRQGVQLKFWYSGYGYNSAVGRSVWQIGYATSPFVALSAADPPGNLPKEFALLQSYPNPFNPEVSIEYFLPKEEHVSVKVIDALGQEVVTLIDQRQAAGRHAVYWNANGYATGVYFYRMTAGEFSDSKKMILVR